MTEDLNITSVLYSKDNVTRKYVQQTKDNYGIETTYVDYKNKHIICFSTQVGCNLGCRFCYNGLMHNFVRNLTYREICSQIENVMLRENIEKNKPILFSAMGIGEPLLNYDNLIFTFKYLNEKYPKNRFALATTGVNLDNILRLVLDLKDIDFKLTISLHSVNDNKRKDLMPFTMEVKKLIQVVKRYEILSRSKVEWNYVLFDGINDSLEDAIELFDMLGNREIIKINKFNKVDISNLKESKNIVKFIEYLNVLGMSAEYYETNGEDINAACGQMLADTKVTRRLLK